MENIPQNIISVVDIEYGIVVKGDLFMVNKINAEYFNSLATDIHANENKKWWYDQDGSEIINPDHRLLILVVSEIIESLEGYRKSLKDDKLPHRDMVEVELADAVVRMLDRMVGKKLEPFKNDYYKYIISGECLDNDFTSQLYHAVGLLTNPLTRDNTELIVYYLLDIGYTLGYDVISAIDEKRNYNSTRVDHSYESRKKANGKKF